MVPNKLWPVTAGFLWIVLGIIACSSLDFSPPKGVTDSFNVGQLAPQFTTTDRKGQVHQLSDFRGKVVLVNFWATWCSPCVEEMPSMESLRKELDQEQLVIVALSVDDSWEPVKLFFRESNFGLMIYSDFEGKIARLYGTEKVPETYILNKQGVIVHKVVGATNWMAPKMLSFLRQLLAV